jgi:hypothetical protein
MKGSDTSRYPYREGLREIESGPKDRVIRNGPELLP